jgi:RHS repeat-associated protein
VQVWRRAPGEAAELLFDATTQVLTGTQLRLDEGFGYETRFDDLLLAQLAGQETQVAFAYDALGRRIQKQVTTAQQTADYRYTNDGWRVAELCGANGTVLADYAYGNGLDEVVRMRRQGQDYHLLQDSQGTVLALADAQGNLLERYTYGPFGEPTVCDADLQPIAGATPSSPYLFAGREYDPETGLYNQRYRYYDPRAGRFITRDPLGAWADPTALGNPYTYCGNSPWDTLDPLGLDSTSWTSHFWPSLGSVFSDIGGAVGSFCLSLFPNVNFFQHTTPLQPLSADTYLSMANGDMGSQPYKNLFSYMNGEKDEKLKQFVAGTGEVLKDAAETCILNKVGEAGGAALGSLGPYLDDMFRRGLESGLPEDILDLMKKNITDSGEAVLGPNGLYQPLAQQLGASYFDIGDRWGALKAMKQEWTANELFLDILASRGDKFTLAIPGSQAREGSYFEQELKYLQEKWHYHYTSPTTLER